MKMEESEVVIVGAGIAGLATAIALQKLGLGFLVLEKAPELRHSGATIALFPNAFTALESLGVAHHLLPLYTHLHMTSITDIRTGVVRDVTFGDPNSTEGKPVIVHRKVLLETLAAEIPDDRIKFSSKVVSIDADAVVRSGSKGIVLRLEDGGVIHTRALIGCDGVHSTVAEWLGLAKPIDTGRAAARGLAVFPDGHSMKPNRGRQFVGVGKRAAIIPVDDKQVYWFISGTFDREDDLLDGGPEAVRRSVGDEHGRDMPEAFKEAVRNSDDSTVSWTRLMYRAPWDVMTTSGLSRGAVTVVGDAMHPMTPDLGQGGCVALEDAVVLGRHARGWVRGRNTVEGAFKGYAEERRWRVAALIAGSYLSGWIQERGNSTVMRFVRDVVFYRALFPLILKFTCRH